MNGMQWYVARRILWAVFVAWFTLSVTWGLLVISPNSGDLAAAQRCAMQDVDPETCIEREQERTGRAAPLHERYTRYFGNVLTLDFGYSQEFEQSVVTLFSERYPYSLQYSLPVGILTVLVGYGLGLYSAMNQYTKSDYVATFIAFFGLSIPNFWFALVLVLITGVWFSDAVILGVELAPFALPVYYKTQVVRTHGWISLANVRQILLPIVVLSTAAFASHMRYSRAYALEYANAAFTKTARAKGAGDRRVLVRHVFRVALVPLATIIVFDVLNVLLAGTLIVEYIFSIPGLGLITYEAFLNQDTAVVMASTLLGVFVAVLGYLLQDVAYVYLDPRIDIGDTGG